MRASTARGSLNSLSAAAAALLTRGDGICSALINVGEESEVADAHEPFRMSYSLDGAPS